MYYHVRLSVAGSKHDEVTPDLDAAILERQFLEPYRTGRPIVANGKTVSLENLERIRITASEEPIAELIERVKASSRTSGVVVVGGPSYASRAAARAADVTDQFITAPPGGELAASDQIDAGSAGVLSEAESSRSDADDRRAVFVVAGRDLAAARAVSTFLRALQLHVIEWEHAVARTGLPSPYVGDVVLAGLRMAHGVVVILSPDDLVRLREDLIRDEDEARERETRAQARPNVYYEAGIADALARERTIIVEIGAVKSFSDAAGRHVVRFDGSIAARHVLAKRLEIAGLHVDTTGQDWLDAGNMEDVLRAAARPVSVGDETAESGKIDKQELLERIGELLEVYASMQAKSTYDDLSDLPQESLEFVIRVQSLVDSLGPDSSAAVEAARVADDPPHVRLRILVAILGALRLELDG